MATLAIQQSAFSGQSAVKPQNELAQKVGSFNGECVVLSKVPPKAFGKFIHFLIC